MKLGEETSCKTWLYKLAKTTLSKLFKVDIAIAGNLKMDAMLLQCFADSKWSIGWRAEQYLQSCSPCLQQISFPGASLDLPCAQEGSEQAWQSKDKCCIAAVAASSLILQQSIQGQGGKHSVCNAACRMVLYFVTLPED